MSRKLKLTGRGYETFTGEYCGVDFVNGVSVDVVNKTDCHKISMLLGAVDAETGESVGLYAEQEKKRAEERKKIRAELERKQAQTESQKQSEKKTPAVEIEFTEESLGEIADKEGIAGLRKIADKYGIKGRGISELISELLEYKAQFDEPEQS